MANRPAKKTGRKRADIPRPYNGGEWTDARFRSFVTSALRRAQWPPKYRVIKSAECGEEINPATGRKRKLFRCAECGGSFPQKEMQADHIDPVVDPAAGFQGWDVFIMRLFVEESGFRAVCKACHHKITQEQRKAR